ncbi:MAG: hypothetical protein IJ846_07230 [Alphaproteobacteria bacterium]|nr:hypothetical protein [Alphaproteobacteria bacterium]
MEIEKKYDVTVKTIRKSEQSYVTQIYESLGWSVTSAAPSLSDKKAIDVSFRRLSDIDDKQERNRLEKEADKELDFIKMSAKTEGKIPKINSYILGVVGTLMLGGGMSLILSGDYTVLKFVLGNVIGGLGIALCAVNNLIYKRFLTKKQNESYEKIEAARKNLDTVCEKAKVLLHAEKE